MFKKHKQLIIGFLLGALVFGIIPVGATVQDYMLKKSEVRLMVNGKESANKELPVLNYQGYNYIPAATFREITDTMGVGFEWVGEKNEIQINTNKNVITEPAKEENSTEERKGESMVNVEKDGYDLLVVDGTEYMSLRVANQNMPEGYELLAHYESKTIQFVYQKDKDRFGRVESETILLENIPYKIFYDTTHISNSYYQNTILPIMKTEGN